MNLQFVLCEECQTFRSVYSPFFIFMICCCVWRLHLQDIQCDFDVVETACSGIDDDLPQSKPQRVRQEGKFTAWKDFGENNRRSLFVDMQAYEKRDKGEFSSPYLLSLLFIAESKVLGLQNAQFLSQLQHLVRQGAKAIENVVDLHSIEVLNFLSRSTILVLFVCRRYVACGHPYLLQHVFAKVTRHGSKRVKMAIER